MSGVVSVMAELRLIVAGSKVLLEVTDSLVTTNTRDLLAALLFRMRIDRAGDLLMTFPTSLFGYFSAASGDLNLVFKTTGGEVIGMPEAVARFRGVLAQKAGRRVAVVAHSDRPM